MSDKVNLEIIYSKEAKQNIKKMKRAKTRLMPQTTFLTYTIIVINLIILIIMEFSGGSQNVYTLLDFGAVYRDYVFGNNQYYRLFTSMFLHIGFEHLLYNSLSLYIFGTRVERHFGRINFLIIYILSGIAGSFFLILTSNSVGAGASGAIFGLTGATLALTQITKEFVDGLNYKTIVALILANIIFGLIMTDIGNAAHVGGLAAGYVSGYIIVKLKLSKR